MRTFLTIWAGQIFSVVGSGMTAFALGLWVYEQTGEATPFVMIALFTSIPFFVVTPFAGALVDRLNRKAVMLASDAGNAAVTLSLLALFASGRLELWHLYLAALLSSSLNLFQLLAYQTIVTSLVPRAQYGRANALVQTAQSLGSILSPILAAVVYGTLGLGFIFGLDLAGFAVAALTLLLAKVPQAKRSVEAGQSSLWADIRVGFNFIKTRHGLIGLAVLMALLNLMIQASMALSAPMILGFTSAQVLGVVQSVSSIGLLLGGVWASAWSNPPRKVLTIVICSAAAGLGMVISGLQPNPVLIAAGFFIFMFPVTAINANLRAIVQVKVPEDLQGRVFSLILTTARAGIPLALLMSGPLADQVFEPGMAAGGALAAGPLGAIFGAGPGRGIGLMLALSGLGMIAASGLMYAYPRLRHVERELPDVETS